MSLSVRSWAVAACLLSLAFACRRSARDDHRDEPLQAAPVPAQEKAREAPPLDVSRVFPTVESVGAKKRIHWQKTAPTGSYSWDIVVADSASAAAIDNAINFTATSN